MMDEKNEIKNGERKERERGEMNMYYRR